MKECNSNKYIDQIRKLEITLSQTNDKTGQVALAEKVNGILREYLTYQKTLRSTSNAN